MTRLGPTLRWLMIALLATASGAAAAADDSKPQAADGEAKAKTPSVARAEAETSEASPSAASEAADSSASLLAAPASSDMAKVERGVATSHREAIGPFLQRFCIDCHSGDEPEGGVAMDRLLDAPDMASQLKAWKRVLGMLRVEAMPPDEAERPDAKQYATHVAWLASRLEEIERSQPPDPGRVTARRLNRAEYDNTIRDLFGIDLRVADDFPADDVGYGFDNIGDVLSLPPLLMEKYLDAAERIAQYVIPLEEPRPRVERYEAEQFAIRGQGGAPSGSVFAFTSVGTAGTEVEFPLTGDYVIRVRAYGQLAGDEPPRMLVKIDEKRVEQFDVAVDAQNPQTYEHRVRIERGRHRVLVGFVNDFYQPNDPDPGNRDRNLYIDFIEIEGPFDAELPPVPEFGQRVLAVAPKSRDWAQWEQAARDVLTPLVRRAFRRPVKDNDVARLLRIVRMAYDEEESFPAAIQLAIQAVLVSPHFLFRIEHDPDPLDPRAVHTITPHELATRLSYFLWSSLPDDELFRLAEDGMLQRPEVLAQQVRRMLADERSWALVENFGGQWFQLRNLETVNPDPKRFPAFDDALREAMRRETELFFAEIVREDRSILDILDADFTYVNERLARHYGIEGVKGDAFRRVKLNDRNRGGVLTQASVLTVTSNPTRTSPVKRGKWVLENLLAVKLPPPPPNVPLLDEGEEAASAASLRERMELHRQKASCAVCHAQMDPPGFGLENFDPIGAWRTEDGEYPIDASGTLPDGQSFNGPAELKTILLNRRDDFCRCMAEKMLTYALGRGLESYDRAAIEQIVQQTIAADYRFSALVIAVVQSQPFQMRRGEKPEPPTEEPTRNE